MPDQVLVDTDVASYLFKSSPAARQFLPMLTAKQPVLSFVTVAELLKWTIKRGWSSSKVRQLEATLKRYVIVAYDWDMAWCWAKVTAECEAAGKPMAASDAWIAAAAIRYGIPLLTNNVKHFTQAKMTCGLQLLLPDTSGKS